LEETATVIDRLLVLKRELVPELTHAKAMVLFELKDWDGVLKNISASEEVARKKERPILRHWLIHKYGAYIELGDTAAAAKVLAEVKDNYTDDGEYERLMSLKPGEMRVLTGEPSGKKPRSKLILHVAPVYPEEAMGSGLVGWVMLLFTVDETGNVKNPVVVENCAVLNEGDKPQCAHSPNAIFDQAALNTIRQSKYEPVVIDGVATTSQALTRVEFWLSPTTNN
jgi:TonB family protein